MSLKFGSVGHLRTLNLFSTFPPIIGLCHTDIVMDLCMSHVFISPSLVTYWPSCLPPPCLLVLLLTHFDVLLPTGYPYFVLWFQFHDHMSESNHGYILSMIKTTGGLFKPHAWFVVERGEGVT